MLGPPLILGEIKLENLQLKTVQRLMSLTKAWHRPDIDIFNDIFTTEVASLLHLRNCAILQDYLETLTEV
jgi:hypothetical protein